MCRPHDYIDYLTKEPYKEHCFMKLFLLSLCLHHIRKIGNTYLAILLFPCLCLPTDSIYQIQNSNEIALFIIFGTFMIIHSVFLDLSFISNGLHVPQNYRMRMRHTRNL